MLDAKTGTFLKVVELGSYTAAAAALHLTQPAVSQHIQKLEEHYGCRFFTLEGRALRLTEEGTRFLHYAKMQQANERQLLQQLAGNPAPLRIGSTLSIADYYLPPLLAPMAAQPLAPLQVDVANTGTLLQKLLNGELDAAFIEGMFDHKLFEAQVFFQARFLPVAAAAHPLAGRRATLEELHGFPLLLREQGSGTRAILENHLARENDTAASFAQVWEVGSFLLIKRLLETSQAVSFMYEAVAQQEVAQGKLAFLELFNYSVTHSLHFVCLKNSLEKNRAAEFYARCLASRENSPPCAPSVQT